MFGENIVLQLGCLMSFSFLSVVSLLLSNIISFLIVRFHVDKLSSAHVYLRLPKVTKYFASQI